MSKRAKKTRIRPELYMMLSLACFLGGAGLFALSAGHLLSIAGIALACLGVIFLGLHSRGEHRAAMELLNDKDDTTST